MKKDIFNFRRFGKYFMSDIRTCTANYGLTLITISILSLLLVYVLTVGSGLMVDHVWEGPGIMARAMTFMVAMLAIVISMPVKSYGGLTEKKYGTFWLTIPASKMEKFAGIIIMSCIIAPLAGAVLFILSDAIICILDPTCGTPVISSITNLTVSVSEAISADADLAQTPNLARFIRQITSPWLYIDDAFGLALPFVLGAISFKNSKTSKTILALVALGIFSSVIISPLILNMEWMNSINEINAEGITDIAGSELIFSHWIFRNIALADTISDTVANLAFMTAIYFRIKTLKH